MRKKSKHWTCKCGKDLPWSTLQCLVCGMTQPIGDRILTEGVDRYNDLHPDALHAAVMLKQGKKVRFTPEEKRGHRRHACRLAGEGMKVVEIQKELKEKFGIARSYSLIDYWLKHPVKQKQDVDEMEKEHEAWEQASISDLSKASGTRGKLSLKEFVESKVAEMKTAPPQKYKPSVKTRAYRLFVKGETDAHVMLSMLAEECEPNLLPSSAEIERWVNQWSGNLPDVTRPDDELPAPEFHSIDGEIKRQEEMEAEIDRKVTDSLLHFSYKQTRVELPPTPENVDFVKGLLEKVRAGA